MGAAASPQKTLVAAKIEKMGSPSAKFEGYTNPVAVSELERRSSELEIESADLLAQLQAMTARAELVRNLYTWIMVLVFLELCPEPSGPHAGLWALFLGAIICVWVLSSIWDPPSV